MLFLVVISFSSFRRSAFQKFSDFWSFGGSKPNRRMSKAKTIEIVLMACSPAENRRGQDAEQNTEQRT